MLKDTEAADSPVEYTCTGTETSPKEIVAVPIERTGMRPSPGGTVGSTRDAPRITPGHGPRQFARERVNPAMRLPPGRQPTRSLQRRRQGQRDMRRPGPIKLHLPGGLYGELVAAEAGHEIQTHFDSCRNPGGRHDVAGIDPA